MKQDKLVKIVYCISSLAIIRGGQRMLAIKANYFAKHWGYEIHVITTDEGDKQPYFPLHPSIQVHNLDINYDKWMPLYKRLFSHFYKRYLYRKRLKKSLNQIKPDFTILMLRRELGFIMDMNDGSIKIAENHFERESYLNSANYSLLRYCPNFIWKRWKKKQVEYIKKLHRFIVLTNEDAAKWGELDNVTVIPNPLALMPESLSSGASKQVIAVGHYGMQKGFDMLIAAWKIIAVKHKDWNLKIFGDGPLRETLQRQIDDEGLRDSCKLEMPVPDITSKYVESSIFVLSSRYEGFGLVIIEAMACGLPVISFNCQCGPKEIITNNEDGILVKTGDIAALAQQILFLIENEEVRKRMRTKALLKIQKYRIENIAVLWKDLFEKLLEEKK